MGFQNLRPNNTLYILYKSIPKLEIGRVNNDKHHKHKYKGSFQDMIVDISTNIDDSITNFQKVPANLEIADVGNDMVISYDRQRISDEIKTLKSRSESALESIDFHKKMIKECNDFIRILNPEIAEKEQRDQETKQLKEEISSLKEMFSSFMEQFKQ